MATFIAGSVLGALAPDPAVLVAARVVMGVGASAMLALSLAIVSDDFPIAERPRALGIWTAVSAVALAVGPLVGGVLIDGLGWRFIFWLNLPSPGSAARAAPAPPASRATRPPVTGSTWRAWSR